MSGRGDGKSTTFGESTSRKSSALGVVPGDSTEVWGEIHMNRGRVGEERGGKETDRCPLTELLNIEILMRGVDYRKEVGVVQMLLDMYRDRGEYIWT
jgi:hypothetical protein